MSSRDTDNDSGIFSYGLRELDSHRAPQELRVISRPLKAAKDSQGVDPYNTSGSFDRKKNWSRVGKR